MGVFAVPGRDHGGPSGDHDDVDSSISEEKRELTHITEAIKSYEAFRWPDAKDPGGKE